MRARAAPPTMDRVALHTQARVVLVMTAPAVPSMTHLAVVHFPAQVVLVTTARAAPPTMARVALHIQARVVPAIMAQAVPVIRVPGVEPPVQTFADNQTA
jgi:hypothetical protein